MAEGMEVDPIESEKRDIKRVEDKQGVFLLSDVFHCQMLECLDVPLLIPHMSNIPSDFRLDVCRGYSSRREFVNRFIEYINKAPKEGWFQEFMTALSESRQRILANILNDASQTHPKDLDLKKKLIYRYSPQLSKTIVDTDELITKLTMEECITTCEREELLSFSTMRGNEAALLLLLTLLPIKSPTWFQSFSEFMDEKHANQAIWQEIKTEVQRMEAAGDMETNTGRMADVRIEHMRVCEGASCELKDAPSSCYAEIGESSFQRAPSITSNNRIFEIICELRQEIEGVLKSLLTKEGSTVTWLSPPFDPSHFSAYDDWLARIKKLSKKVNFREVQICITNLRAYKHALMIQRYCSDRSCVQFLAEELQGLFRGPVSSKSCKTHLCTIYNDRCKELECAVVPRNSQLFEALKEKILQTNSDHPSHKIIVYCNSAIVGTVLKTLLEADPLISRLHPTTDKSCFQHLLVTNEKDRPSHDVIFCVEDL